MKLIPALDLMDGGPVRLAKGDFDARTDYRADPAQAVAGFVAAGAELVHLVDLDGARAKEPRQHDLIAKIAATQPVQVAGGIRTLDHVKRLVDAGARRVVVGSLALEDPALFATMLDKFGPAMVLALDVNITGGEPMVATHGWTQDSGRSLADVLGDFAGVAHILVTDIARDGMMQGPNVPLYAHLAKSYPDIAVQASGGVSALDDLTTLRATGVSGAIVGKAIWENVFTVEAGIAYARG